MIRWLFRFLQSAQVKHDVYHLKCKVCGHINEVSGDVLLDHCGGCGVFLSPENIDRSQEI